MNVPIPALLKKLVARKDLTEDEAFPRCGVSP